MLLHRLVAFAPSVVVLAALAAPHAASPAAPPAPVAPVALATPAAVGSTASMLTTRAYIPVIDARRMSIVCGAGPNPSDVLIEYFGPDGPGAGSAVVETLHMAANGSALHRVNPNHPALSGGHGLIRLLSTNPNPGEFYAYLSAGSSTVPVSGPSFLGFSYRLPYVPVQLGTQKIRIAVTNPGSATVAAFVTNIGGHTTTLNLAPLTTVLWDSDVEGEVVNSFSAMTMQSIGGEISVAAAITRDGTITYSFPAVYL